MTETTALTANGISFRYKDAAANALTGVSFELHQGETLAIVGHNGSGKSTLLRVLSGILIPNEGILTIQGQEVTDDNAMALFTQNVGMVLQNPDAQFVASTIREDLAFGLENQRVDPKAMDPMIGKALDEVGMLSRINDDPNALSGGQKQRIALAGILIRKPSILLLDEATAMLDSKSKVELAQVFQSIRKADPKLAIVSVTHEYLEAISADRVIVLDGGKIVYSGNPKALFASVDRCRRFGLEPSFEARLSAALKQDGIAADGFSDPEELIACLRK